MNTKAILATSLLTALIAGTSAQAQGRAGNVYDNAQAAPSVKIVKVSLQAPVAVDAEDVNR